MTNSAKPGAPIDPAWDDSRTEITPAPVDTAKRTMIGVPIARPPAKAPLIAQAAGAVSPPATAVSARGSDPAVAPMLANVTYDVPMDESAEATVFQPQAPLPLDRPVLARDAAAALLSRDSATAVSPPPVAMRSAPPKDPRRRRVALSLGSFALAAAAAFGAVWHFAGPADAPDAPAKVAAPAVDVPVAKPAPPARARPVEAPAAQEAAAVDDAPAAPAAAAPAAGEPPAAVEAKTAPAVAKTEKTEPKPVVAPKAAPKPAAPKPRRTKAACSGLDCL